MQRKALWLAASLVALVSQAVQASERVALVVGNANYHHAPPLANPRNDAEDIAVLLRGLGFQVTAGVDLDDAAMEDRVRSFSRRARTADVALLFYAGHGLQVDGVNYLVPVDAQLADEADLPFETLPLDLILERMGGGTNLVFLDACRDNPFARSWAGAGRTTAVGRGLTRVGGASGSGLFIAFATDPDHIAADGEGRNSPFTAALKRHIETPGLEINHLLTEVRKAVLASTGDVQRPWSNSSLSDAFYFVPPSPAGAKPDVPSRAGAPDPSTEMWLQIRELGDVRILERFLNEYPHSPYRLPAEARLAALRQAARSGTERILGCEWCPELVEIPAGRFRMGDLTGAGHANEQPVRRVHVPRFALARHETTVGQFRRFVMATGYRTEAELESARGCRTWELATRTSLDWTPARSWRRVEYALAEDQPVVCVSWNDTRAYIAWLNEQTGGGWRLPSEAEWEYAARAGGETLYHFGDDASRLCDYGNVADTTPFLNGLGWINRAECADDTVYPTQVGSYRSNALGLHDMHGNVWEWTTDCWNNSYADAPADGNASEGGLCSVRVIRGGSWNSPPSILRVAYRDRDSTSGRRDNIGFRVARTLTP